MATILDIPSVGGRLGSAFGTGLQRLAESKLSELSARSLRNDAASGLEALGIPREKARSIASLDPSLQREYVKQVFAQPAQKEFARGLQSLLGGNQEQLGQEQAVEQPNQELGLGSSISGSKLVAPTISARLNEKQASTLGKLALQKQAVETKEAGKLKLEEQKANNRRKTESREFLRGLHDKAQVAKFSDARLNKMEELINRGNLPTSAMYSLLKNLEEHVNPVHAAGAGAVAGGLLSSPVGGVAAPAGAAIGGAIGGLINPVATLLRAGQRSWNVDQEEFEKLSADFIKDAKGIFGSRLTDADLRAFLQTVPTLSQTDAGKKQIIKNMKAFNEAAKIKLKTAKDIINENNGIVPPDLQLLVEEESSEKLDKWAEKFATGQ